MNVAARILAHASYRPASPACIFLPKGETEEQVTTWRELVQDSAQFAERLISNHLEGKRVVLSLPEGPEFVVALLGCMQAGATAVPTPAAHKRDTARSQRVAAIVRDCAAAAVLKRSQTSSSGSIGIEIDTGAVDGQEAMPSRVPPAVIQYTSGSTSQPKGVCLSDENLSSNIEAIGTKLQVSEDTVAVNWLPFHHDMGLIGNLLSSLFHGGLLVYMPPLRFVQRPSRWLRTISRYRASHSGGPGFAFDRCVQQASELLDADIDLRSWQYAFCGADFIRSDTLESFSAQFRPLGFDARSFYPCYGLAESTLLVTGADERREPVVRRFDRDRLLQHEAIVTEQSQSASMVSCGSVVTGHQLCVRDPMTGAPCRDGVIGELWLKGPSITKGYWSSGVEGSPDPGPGSILNSEGYLQTGDLGFLLDGELYVVGRLKDVIVLNGQNIYPDDLEAALQRDGSDPGWGAAAVIQKIENGVAEADELVLVQEVGAKSAGEYQSAAERMFELIARVHQIGVDEIIFVSMGSLPRTTSGKVRRSELRRLVVEGGLPEVFNWRKQDAAARLLRANA